MGFLRHPRQLWWRKVLFQVHLWVGLIIGLYIIVIGVTGSLLVFKNELAALSYPELVKAEPVEQEQIANLALVMENARAAFPEQKAVSGFVPGVFGGNFLVYLEGKNEAGTFAFASPTTGEIIGGFALEQSWINWIAELHVQLLGGPVGFVINGIGGAFLVLLCLSGIVLWWPGIRGWTCALKVNFRRNWKKINFDLHSAIGFWLLSIIFLWAISTVFFVWPKQFVAVVSLISPAETAIEPEIKVTPSLPGKVADLRDMLKEAQHELPGTQLSGVYYPQEPNSAVRVFMARKSVDNYSEMDYAYFDPSSGKRLAVWHAGINPTLGGKLVYWMGPLHFGVYWGLGIKILWALLGLSLPILTVTGALMYWNRSLSRYWKRLRTGDGMGEKVEVLRDTRELNFKN